MTKNEFLDELRKELKINNITEIDDIISDYEEHFAFKLEEGRTEEEVVKKLQSPKNIAKEYLSVNKEPINKYEKGIKRLNIILLSIPAILVYAFMWLTVVAVFSVSVVSLGLGFCLLTTINIGRIIPYIPYFSAFISSISCFSLAVVAFIGAFYMALYIKQWGKIYLRWSSNYINGGNYLSISKQPIISKKLSFVLKLTLIISSICLVAFFILGYFTMAVKAGSLEFWHVWNWFV